MEDSFQSSVNRNPTLSDIDKFTYLMDLLQQSVRVSITRLTLNSPDYKEAVSILEKDLGNVQQISRHMNLLLKLEHFRLTYQLKSPERLWQCWDSCTQAMDSRCWFQDLWYPISLYSPARFHAEELRLILSKKNSDVWLEKVEQESLWGEGSDYSTNPQSIHKKTTWTVTYILQLACSLETLLLTAVTTIVHPPMPDNHSYPALEDVQW